MRDFDWTDRMWAVIKDNGQFAGCPCLSFEEARELANQHPGAHIFRLACDSEYKISDDEFF